MQEFFGNLILLAIDKGYWWQMLITLFVLVCGFFLWRKYVPYRVHFYILVSLDHAAKKAEKEMRGSQKSAAITRFADVSPTEMHASSLILKNPVFINTDSGWKIVKGDILAADNGKSVVDKLGQKIQGRPWVETKTLNHFLKNP